MGKEILGEFEELVLLTVAVLQGGAYGASIADEMERRLDRTVSLGAIQTVLRRLEHKGFLRSEFGEATPLRGGKRKRMFVITGSGFSMLEAARDRRSALWSAIPKTAFTD